MTIKEIRELNRGGIIKAIQELKQERLNLRIQQQTGQLENPARLRTIRREIARMQTILTQRANAPTTTNA